MIIFFLILLIGVTALCAAGNYLFKRFLGPVADRRGEHEASEIAWKNRVRPPRSPARKKRGL